jgi:hypothetical protein
MNRRLFLLGLALLFFTTRPAPAASTPEQGIVKGKTAQGFPYMSGGIGADERALMGKEAKDYNLKLAFAERSGQYLAEVKLVVAGEDGKEIINTTTNGPWFYIKLPPGTYNVRAAVGNITKKIDSLSLSKEKPVTRLLHW